MTSLDPLREASASLIGAAFEAFGEVSSRVSFKAILDGALGDVCTDFCIRLAAELKRSPAEIWSLLAARLRTPLPGETAQEQGYLNFRFDDRTVREASFSSLPALEGTHAIVLPSPGRGLSGRTFLRLYCLGAFQAWLAGLMGARAVLLVGGVEIALEQADLAGLLNAGIERAGGPAQSSPPCLEQALSGLPLPSVAHTTVWLPQEAMSAGPINAFFHSDSARWQTHRFKAPPQSWLHTPDDESDLESLRRLPGDSLLLYLAGPQSAAELDFLVPGLDEGANLSWLHASVLERLRRLAQAAPFGSTLGSEAPLEPIHREQLLRLKLYPLFALQAAASGETIELISAHAALLRLGSRLMNDPALRLRHSERRMGSSEASCLSGLLELLERDRVASRLTYRTAV